MNTPRYLVPWLVSLSVAPLPAGDFRTVLFPAGPPSAPLTVEPGGHIGFTVWDKGARRTLYLLNVDWQNPDESRPAVLLLGASRFAVNARRYALETIHCAEGLAIMPGANTTDVLAITRHANGWQVKIQTTAPDAIRVFNAATGASQSQQLTTPGTHDLEIN